MAAGCVHRPAAQVEAEDSDKGPKGPSAPDWADFRAGLSLDRSMSGLVESGLADLRMNVGGEWMI
jgi:hypothetical protein